MRGRVQNQPGHEADNARREADARVFERSGAVVVVQAEDKYIPHGVVLADRI